MVYYTKNQVILVSNMNDWSMIKYSEFLLYNKKQVVYSYIYMCS